MENSKIIFTETQKPHQWQIQLFVLLYSVIITFMVVKQVYFNIPFLNLHLPNFLLVSLWFLFGVLVPILYYKSYLLTELREDGLYLKYFPFHLKPIKLPLEHLKDMEIITYEPLKDYGGWGIRASKKGYAFNAYGNRGVLLKFEHTKDVLIGSQKSEELYNSMKRYQLQN